MSPVLLVGQAPGAREPALARPFAWTAGRTLFGWFESCCGLAEIAFRKHIYMAAVCRCFPGKSKSGGDRMPNAQEIDACDSWLGAEIEILRPRLVIPVGKLAIAKFLPEMPLTQLVGHLYKATRDGVAFDLVPLPHPSGASPWHRVEPGRTLLKRALQKIAQHPAMIVVVEQARME
jgi:uracil-DNA glycosylase